MREGLIKAIEKIPLVKLDILSLGYIAHVANMHEARIDAAKALGISLRCLFYKLKEAEIAGFKVLRKDPDFFIH